MCVCVYTYIYADLSAWWVTFSDMYFSFMNMNLIFCEFGRLVTCSCWGTKKNKKSHSLKVTVVLVTVPSRKVMESIVIWGKWLKNVSGQACWDFFIIFFLDIAEELEAGLLTQMWLYWLSEIQRAAVHLTLSVSLGMQISLPLYLCNCNALK